ncbi:acyl carrier protein [Jatrophihabitans sp.]|jgi:acyl carrier protein|uniref:acyl carrier protein n=1 Tax=Jatrophihabitans sp. TaxID=1932789 RepID=UPI002EDE4160
MSVLEAVKAILIDDVFVEIPAEEIQPQDGLRDVLGLDSVGFVELRVQCEARFGIEISEADFAPENFGTVGQVADLVERLITTRLSAATPA